MLDALSDIQRLRNRSSHDGYEIAEEDALLAIRKLVDLLSWFATTRSQAFISDQPSLVREVALESEFLAGSTPRWATATPRRLNSHPTPSTSCSSGLQECEMTMSSC